MLAPWFTMLPILDEPVKPMPRPPIPMFVLLDPHALAWGPEGGGAMEKEEEADAMPPPGGGGGGSVKDGVREVAAGPCPRDMLAIDEFILPPNPEAEGVEGPEPQGFAGAAADAQLTDVAGA